MSKELELLQEVVKILEEREAQQCLRCSPILYLFLFSI